jgi:hypothetical protein
MKVIVRDDDVSYFTPPEFLEMLYESLWANGLPVCLSVIPNHYDSVVVAYRSSSAEPDENTPPSHFGTGITHPVWKNSRLASFLSTLANTGSVELCVHGFEHRYREFDADADRARECLVSSLEIFAATFPLVKPTTFVPPYEALSRAALKALADHGFDIATCLDTARSMKLVGASDSQDDGIFEGDGDSVVFACATYLFDPLRTDASVEDALEESLRRNPDLLIIANHYWDFFDRFKAPKTNRIRLWAAFVRALIARDAVFTTFGQEAIQFRRSYL